MLCYSIVIHLLGAVGHNESDAPMSMCHRVKAALKMAVSTRRVPDI